MTLCNDWKRNRRKWYYPSSLLKLQVRIYDMILPSFNEELHVLKLCGIHFPWKLGLFPEIHYKLTIETENDENGTFSHLNLRLDIEPLLTYNTLFCREFEALQSSGFRFLEKVHTLAIEKKNWFSECANALRVNAPHRERAPFLKSFCNCKEQVYQISTLYHKMQRPFA